MKVHYEYGGEGEFKRNRRRYLKSRRNTRRDIEFIEKEEKVLINKRPFRLAEEYWDTLGPGLTTGAADDDPRASRPTRRRARSTASSSSGSPLHLSLHGGGAGDVRAHRDRERQGSRRISAALSAARALSGHWLLFFANTLNIGADLGAMAPRRASSSQNSASNSSSSSSLSVSSSRYSRPMRGMQNI